MLHGTELSWRRIPSGFFKTCREFFKENLKEIATHMACVEGSSLKTRPRFTDCLIERSKVAAGESTPKYFRNGIRNGDSPEGYSVRLPDYQIAKGTNHPEARVPQAMGQSCSRPNYIFCVRLW